MICSILRRLKREERGATHEAISFLLAVIPIIGIVIPLVGETILGYVQLQEVEALTKLAAERACSMKPSNLNPNSTGGDIGQGALGVAFRRADLVNAMQETVEDVFRTQSTRPEGYFDGSPDAGLPILTIQDPLGQDITNDEEDFVGASSSISLCPAGESWDWCRNGGNDAQIRERFTNNALAEEFEGPNPTRDANVESDLSARMQILNDSRCPPGMDGATCANIINGSLNDKIYRCTVCVTKIRDSVFDFTIPMLGGESFTLGCQDAGMRANSTIPCVIHKCNSAKYQSTSASKIYSQAYGSRRNPGAPSTSRLEHYVNYEAMHGGSEIRTVLRDENDEIIFEDVRGATEHINQDTDQYENIDSDFFAEDDHLDSE